jgi:hypothetical protein
MIRRTGRHRLGHPAVNGAAANILEGFLHHFPAATAGVIDVGEKVQRAYGRIGEHENRVDEVVVLKIRRRFTAIHELAIFERAAMKAAAAQFDAFPSEGLVLIEHRSTPHSG